jgi:hypothetical protein
MGCTVWGSSPFAIRAPNVFAKVEQVDTEFLSGDIELSPISAETAGTSSTTGITCTLPVDDAHATLPAFKACPTHSIAFMANRRLATAVDMNQQMGFAICERRLKRLEAVLDQSPNASLGSGHAARPTSCAHVPIFVTPITPSLPWCVR